MILHSLVLALPLAQLGAGSPLQPGLAHAEHVAVDRGKEDPTLHMELALASMEPETPMVVLYHRLGSSTGEYASIVPRLVALGFNCLAVDLRCGGISHRVTNRTMGAMRSKRAATLIEALPDVEASLQWARANRAKGKLLLWGSCFSASLALTTAAAHPELVDGVIALSPAEYFEQLGRSPTWVQDSVRTLDKPVFISSARVEEHEWRPIFAAIPAKSKVGFVPTSPGQPGSSALWQESECQAEYWAALEPFLREHFPAGADSPKGG
jgi:alpha-beta hydrolase superfamily lysophospholipase